MSAVAGRVLSPCVVLYQNSRASLGHVLGTLRSAVALLVRGPRGLVMSNVADIRRLSAAQRWALGVSAGLAVGLAAYGAAGSYRTISDLAARAGVPLPGLVPVGIDGGLVGVVTLDLVLAWTGQPVGWLRQLARLLTVGTVAANISAGWPDPVAVGLHSAAPVMLLVMVEAGRAVLLRRVGYASGTAHGTGSLWDGGCCRRCGRGCCGGGCFSGGLRAIRGRWTWS